ncbi:MAG TPA: glycogen debranching N-terminal domain-containing protein [Acidothermaceae bacterium]
MVRNQQPYLHDLVTCVRAPTLALSEADGQIRPGGAAGLYYSDRRLVNELLVLVGGAPPTPVAKGMRGAHEAWFVGVARNVGDPIADPTVTIERRREVGSDGLREIVSLHNHSTTGVSTTIQLRCGGDLATMSAVKAGTVSTSPPVNPTAAGLHWSDAETAVAVDCDPAPDEQDGRVLGWLIDVPPGATWQVVVAVTCDQARPALFDAPDQSGPAWSPLRVTAGDHRLGRLVERGLTDLEGLLLADPLAPRDRFVGAGSPWFLTLFGRDSLWTARFLLPLGTELAASTLRTLARRQGTLTDAGRSEEPGKILHEVRRAELASDLDLPPVYFGTVDATPLWICLLADAWRWGLPAAEVAELLPHLERALAWMRDDADSDGDGFLEYRPPSAHGLSNQGWKDSNDSVQWLDGRLAQSPIALCEVQGYAYEAAVKAADLLDAFDREGGDEWRAWADRLRLRFREAFWVGTGSDRYPAIALDRDKRRVDTVSSNIGHLLSSGMLDDGECSLVANRLAQPDMNSGAGLRTMTAKSPRYNPLSYHGGCVWPHDTAITILGLAATGHDEIAASLALGVVDASERFEFRLPELYSGHPSPIPYPAACRPQAWAAASAVAIITALLGLRPDVPAGGVEIAPLRGATFGALDVDGVMIAGNRVHVTHDPSGDTPTSVLGLPATLRLDARRPRGSAGTDRARTR